MKLLVSFVLLSVALFANNQFKKDVTYTCLNTHSIQQGQQVDVNTDDAKKNPLVMKITGTKLVTNNDMVFEYRMSRGELSSYSNDSYMLLLTPGLTLGLVPKKSGGQLQYYFKCQE